MSSLFRSLRSVGATLLAFGILSLTAVPESIAQTTTGSIRGRVTSVAGEPIVAATVTARDVDTGRERGTLTTETGFYQLVGLRPGTYEVRVQRIGLREASRTIRVSIGQTLDVGFQLGEQAIELEELQVVAASPVETRTSEVAFNVTREQIENLPLRDRNFLDLARLVPGVRTEQAGDTRKTFAAGAQPAEQVNIFIDGASYKNDVLQGGVAGQDASRGNPFPQNAVEEFRVVTQNYKAEYQKASSAIITATTRTGGNRWEASGFVYHLGDTWVEKDAIAVRDNLPAPDFRRTWAGASIGGPLSRDRLFFFGTYELNFRDEPSDVVPGALPFTPFPIDPDQYAGRFETEFREHLGFGKLTYVPNTRHTIDLSFNVRTETDVRGFGTVVNAPQTSRESSENVQNDVYTVVANHKFAGTNWLNEAQVSFQRYQWNPTPLNSDIVGRNYFGVLRIGGRDTEQDWTQDRLAFRNDLSYVGLNWNGDHTFKAGVSLDFLWYESVKHFVSNPFFNFRSDENYATPFEAFIGFGDPQIGAENVQFGAYVQDDWTVNEHLLFNLGLRWDFETNMINNDHVTPQGIRDSLSGPLNGQLLPTVDDLGGLDAFFTDGGDRPTYLGAIQPRLGVSYDLLGDQRTVFFGGFGIYYDRHFWNMMLDEEFRRQFSVIRLEFDTVAATPAPEWDDKYFDPDTLRALAATGTAGAPEVFLIANDTRPPKTLQWSLGIRQRFGEVFATATYTGSRGYNGFAYVRGTPCCNALLPTYSNLLISTDDIRSWYDALLLKIEKPLRGDSRWGGSIAYTLAEAEQRGDYFFSLDSRYPTVEDYPRWPSSSADQRHNLVANAIFLLPYDFRFSTLLSLGTSLPVRGTDATRGFEPDSVRTIFFRPPHGDGAVLSFRSVDLRLEKGFRFGGQGIGVVMDVFNIMNTANFGCYNTFIPPREDPPNPNFGRPNCADEGRRVQLGIRYDFQPIRQ